MKKRLSYITLLAIFIHVSVFCKNVKEPEKEKNEANYNWAVTIKNGYFYPQDEVLRNIFCRCGGKGGYWIEGAVRYNLWKRLDIEASGSYFSKEGKALDGTTSTKVKIPTLGLGLKYFINFGSLSNNSEILDKISFFVGAGIRIFFYREENGSDAIKRCYKKTTAGGMVNFGFEFDVYKGLFADLFFDYNFKELKPCNCDNCRSYNENTGTCCPSSFADLHLGGLVAGIGLGYKF